MASDSCLCFLVGCLFFTLVTSKGSQNDTSDTADSCKRSHENERDIHIGVLLPADNSRRYSIEHVSPAIDIAMEKLQGITSGIQHKREIAVYYGDSQCNIGAAINQAIDFYLRHPIKVFLGPVCDYAAAPVARQMKYWDIPMITAGAMSGDFGKMKDSEYPLLTRMNGDFNSLAKFLIRLFQEFGFKKVKQIYEYEGHHNVIAKFCHLAADTIYTTLLTHEDLVQDYFKVNKPEETFDKLEDELGREYAGKSNKRHNLEPTYPNTLVSYFC